jgi:hypothetical protein
LRKEAASRLLDGDAVSVAVRFFGSSTGNRAATGNLFAGASSIQGWGVTPENSVVNGADTSTDGSIEWTPLSAKKYVAPLLVKTRGLTAKTLKFCGELTTKCDPCEEVTRAKMKIRGGEGLGAFERGRAVVRAERVVPRRRNILCGRGVVPAQWMPLPNLHRIGYTQNLPARQ